MERDIYHIVLDRYGSEIGLRAYGDIDNSEFIDRLREQGFHVADEANANYAKTILSLASTLGMGLLDAEELGPASKHFNPLAQRIRRSAAGQWLQDHGYEYAHIGSWFDVTERSDIADRSYSLDGAVRDFGTVLYKTTLLPYLSILRVSEEQRHADTAEYQWEVLDSLVDDPAHKYVFAAYPPAA